MWREARVRMYLSASTFLLTTAQLVKKAKALLRELYKNYDEQGITWHRVHQQERGRFLPEPACFS